MGADAPKDAGNLGGC